MPDASGFRLPGVWVAPGRATLAPSGHWAAPPVEAASVLVVRSAHLLVKELLILLLLLLFAHQEGSSEEETDCGHVRVVVRCQRRHGQRGSTCSPVGQDCAKQLRLRLRLLQEVESSGAVAPCASRAPPPRSAPPPPASGAVHCGGLPSPAPWHPSCAHDGATPASDPVSAERSRLRSWRPPRFSEQFNRRVNLRKTLGVGGGVVDWW